MLVFDNCFASLSHLLVSYLWAIRLIVIINKERRKSSTVFYCIVNRLETVERNALADRGTTPRNSACAASVPGASAYL